MKPSKNQLRRAKRKALKSQACAIENNHETPVVQSSGQRVSSPTELPTVTTNSFEESVNLEGENSLWTMYKDVMGRFDDLEDGNSIIRELPKPIIYFDDDNEIPDEEEKEPVISRRKRREMNKLSVAELKAMVRKPEIVEWTDTSAPDPRLLVHLKSHRNVVPVPSHWSLKREYLSSKRGVEKAPFALPKFIQETGISEMRDAALEKQEQATLKQKQRERVQPKMGRLDIDYQKLYEAFFRFQTKPELTRYGEVYYEGKEYETNLRHLRPGELSAELKEALNMPPGAPPPWLINQQRYGPPPSYPALKIPGLNAPPPPGAMWGYHPGGYGKPPVDEHNRPLYGGDIFGVLQPQQAVQQGEPVEKDLWGELQAPELSDDESEDDEDDAASSEFSGDVDDEVDTGLQTPSGMETPSGLVSSIPTENGGPENITGEFDVRKHYRGTQTEESTSQRSAFQVIPERQANVQGFFGADKVYELHKTSDGLPILGSEDSNRKRKKPGDVDVSLDPDALQMEGGIGQAGIRKMYESQKQRDTDPGWNFQEDLSDMIAHESRKRLRKEEEKRKR
ncbi:U2 snRNP complex subunit CUS1 [Aspergillus saccharolyticus JOP 1030-1]|uniref:Splicing factor 3b, subunit 2 n=1 Tax=Aspergillus saccharolyticus JOP 1030-1 TaxID=1450539 RepID=A0A318Z8S7_9EURO|nr:splicing factor 3b, subunit 2 [Aspergillus saccharolyticus JOP 1030-1]PYH41183.1 splicing factor 3b, subunit 2 [Aspergillus saccharolyticus JOP 1030-1]